MKIKASVDENEHRNDSDEHTQPDRAFTGLCTKAPDDEGDQEDEGQRVYMRTLRQDLRERAAMLAHVNAVLRNTLEHAAKGQPLEPVPPATPSEQSDEGLARLIERDYPGQTLATLGESGLEACLKVVEANLAKKRAIMAERGIKDE